MEKEIYRYDIIELRIGLLAAIKQYLEINNYLWLEEKGELIASENKVAQLNLSFAAVSGKAGKKTVNLSAEEIKKFHSVLPSFTIDQWPLHRLCRIFIILKVAAVEKGNYYHKIESLFKNAEMNELADLYAALPVLAYPEIWVKRCEEGIRSNIGIVLDSIMYHNPYPSKYLDEAAWNQMVLKAFFTNKEVNQIIGLDERANALLAATLIDYAHERWAAKRPVNTQLWRLVGKFIDESNFSDIQFIFSSGDINSRKAAALACAQSDYEPARNLLDTVPELKNEIIENTLNWININT